MTEAYFETNKINKRKVKPIKLLEPEDDRPVRGFDLFAEPYANIFLCARKKSGKTSTINTILEQCCGGKTHIVVFCSTLYKDASWRAMKKWATDKKIQFTGFTSLRSDDNKTDLLKAFVTSLQIPDEN